MTAKCSRQALGLPGMLMMSVRLRTADDRAAEHGVRGDGQRGGPHGLGEAREPAGRPRPAWPRECGRAGPSPVPAGGEDQIDLPAVGQGRPAVRSILSLLVGDHVAARPPRRPVRCSNSRRSGPEASARSPALALSLRVTTAARMQAVIAGRCRLTRPVPQATTATRSSRAPPARLCSTRTKMPSRGMTQSPAW